MFSNLQGNMSIFNTLPTTANQVSEWQWIEKNYREMKNTCTFAESEKSNKKEPRKPADTYNILKKNITTYAMPP